MKKVSKIQERSSYISLNGDKLDKIQGGDGAVVVTSPSREDRLCNGGCGRTAAWVTTEESQL